jgi:small conductance mechanosensitive channel
MISLMAEWPIIARVGVAFLVALVAFPAAALAASAVRRLARKGTRIDALDPTVVVFGGELVRVLILIGALVLVLSLAGVEPTSLAAVLGAATLAVGLAMQATLANVAAGVLIFVFAPYRVGEFVEIVGKQGTVKLLSLFTTELESLTGLSYVVANAQVMTQPITNFTRNPNRRVDVDVTLHWSSDTDLALKVALAAVKNDKRVHDAKAIIRSLGDKGPVLSVRLTTITSESAELGFWAAQHVHAALRDAGVRAADVAT